MEKERKMSPVMGYVGVLVALGLIGVTIFMTVTTVNPL